MIFIIFSLFFQIIPPGNYTNLQKNKLKIKSTEKGCGSYTGLTISGGKEKNNIIECTTTGYEFTLQDSTLKDIVSKYYPWSFAQLPDKLIVLKNVQGLIKNNIITGCVTDEEQLILCEDNSDRTLKFISNQISGCYKLESGKYEILSTSYCNNEITDNHITCHASKSSRAFYIKYGRGCKFVRNTVENANQGHSSAIFINAQQSSSHEKLDISDSIFINCRGDNNEDNKIGGIVFVIEQIDYDVLLSNVTFENIQISSAKNSDSSYLFRFQSTSSQIYPVTFSNCKFTQIQTISKGGGGIGFFYNTDGAKTITFDRTIFDHVVCNHNSVGGGALCIDSSINGAKNTRLNVNDCTFIDCSSKCSGGAICFKSSSSQLTVIDCHFIRTFTSSNQNGGAINIQFQENTLPFTIKNCFFIETNSANGGSIFIHPNTDSSTSEVIIEDCDFKNSKAEKEGHSIYVSNTNKNKIIISSCQIIDCGDNKISYSIYLDVNDLEFKYNKIAFSDSDKCCGCIFLATIGSHVFNGNYFKNAKFEGDSATWKSPGIQGGVDSELTTLSIINNTFDSMFGTNQGRCFFIVRKGNNDIQISNNTIQNCPSGGPLLKIWFQTQISTFKIDFCNFINNSIKECYDLIGPTPHIWIENPFNGDHIYQIELILENCRFENCSNSKQGGGLHFGKIKYCANIKLTLIECHFLNNYAKEGGGALSIQTYQGCEIKNCKFIKNRSDEGCGSIFIETDFQCLIDDSKNPTVLLPLPSVRNPTVSITNSNFEENTGKESHGINIINSNNIPVDILECNFIDCGTNGYIISINTDVLNNNIKNCTFNFTTERTSGGINNLNDKLTIIGNYFCNFKETVIRFSCEQTQKFQLIENNFNDCQNCYILYIEKVLNYWPPIKGNYFDSISGDHQLCYIKLKDDIESIAFDNNTFSNFALNSDYGGIGLEIDHENSNSLLSFLFNDCVFTHNTNTKLGGAISFSSYQNSGNAALSLIRCYFIQNYNENKGSSIYCNINNEITIDNCYFYENSGSINGVIHIDQNYESDSTVSKITITNCHFEQNKGKDSTIYLANGHSKTFSIEFCDFEQDYGGIYTDDFNNQIDIMNNIFHKTSEKAALIINSPSKSEEFITVKNCSFDSCSGLDNQCFNILISSKSFIFIDIIMQNNKGTGCSNHFGTIDCKGEISDFDISNISFINNTCNSLYGGGIGLQFIGFKQLTFNDCKFINNVAQQSTSMSRPTKGSKVYYNGDGGGFQIGYSCLLNDVNLLFHDCEFINNCAYRHGGASSIQTIGFVKITNCLFENNKANCKYDESSKLLIENYFDKKSDGRGGAIYINPSYLYDDESLQCNSPDHYMSNVDITNSEFIKNNAYDGYGIYIEGDDPGPNFVININDNIFTDNYNEKNHNDDIYSIFGAVITTEIEKVTEKQINEDNIFNYSIAELKVRNVSVVDHSGRTPTYAFTESDYFPSIGFTKSEVFSYSSIFTISNDFSNSNSFSNSMMFTDSNHFSESSFFSESNYFSETEKFSNSDLFSKSNAFSYSDQFTKSKAFSNSNKFSSSKQFSESDLFSNSKLFSKSDLFSYPDKFSKSNIFSNSNQFSTSEKFSKSNIFSNSDIFSQTDQFTESHLFSDSKQFSKSNKFSNSNQFSKSEKFSKSNVFSNSDFFSKTDQFTESTLFSDSKHFSRSNIFSNSNQFSSSLQFSKSDMFSDSKHFSKSDLFSYSDQFTKSNIFSNSNQFSKSQIFSNSDQFSKSEMFSLSNLFSKTDAFSQSIGFSNSNQFSRSDLFTQSQKFSKSSQFSQSNLFSNSRAFSKSDQFSISDSFTLSDGFTRSDQFSKSQFFSQSSSFSKTNQFSGSNLFSLTNEFTESLEFSISNEFSKSYQFTNSNMFSQSAKFTNSFYFSNSCLFSQSNGFSETNAFSNSDLFSRSTIFSNSKLFSASHSFSNSNDFSVSNMFSQSTMFTESNIFSSSSKFSESDMFSQTGKFSSTKGFSKSNPFSQSIYFSNSNQFSRSIMFSESYHFTESKPLNTHIFTNSKSFTGSVPFSNSNGFTKSISFSRSNAFSESNKFSKTDSFSNSNEFSESIPFTISQTLEYKEPKCIVFEDDNSYLLNDCNYSMSNGKTVLIQVISTNFTYMTDNINGTAIHIDNCGLKCNRTLFLECITTEGCGGAIYIRNDVDIRINVTFEDLIFVNCKAICGGAVFIHSVLDENEILIRNCSFLSNSLYKRNSNSINLFGGSALYISSNNANIINCSFNKNIGKGGCVKLETIDNKKFKILEKDDDANQNPIKISGCTFVNDKKSESFIFYSNENKENAIEITQCNFKGILKKGSSYIDGNILNKEKLRIENCNFDYDSNVSGKNLVILNNQVIDSTKLNWQQISIVAFVFISGFILTIIMLMKSNSDSKINDIESFDHQDLLDQLNENYALDNNENI